MGGTGVLSSDDRTGVERLGDAVLHAADLDGFAEVLLTGLLDLVPALSASYNEVNPTAGRAFARIVPEPAADWWTRFQPVFEAHATDNPLVGHFARTGDHRALTWEDVDPDRLLRRRPLFREFYLPLGIESQLALAVSAHGDVVVGIALNRGREGFSARDRAVVDALRPHIVHAYRTVELATERHRLHQVLVDDGWLTCLVDEDGVVVAAGGSSVLRGDEPLPDDLRPAVVDALRRPPGHQPVAPVRLSSPSVGVVAMVLPGTVPPFVLLVRERSTADAAVVASLGLTKRQGDVALMLAAGRSTSEIALDLGISPATVKKHLEAVHRVLGVRTRAAAVAVLHAHLGSVSAGRPRSG